MYLNLKPCRKIGHVFVYLYPKDREYWTCRLIDVVS